MSKNLKLLTEWFPISCTRELIKESKEQHGGRIVLKGPIQKANTLNQNGRIYPRTILEREVIGSTQKQGSTQIVQDDFQLICFDMVSEPSTPGAFVLKEGKKVSENELKQAFNKSDRINRMFNDILSWE